MVCVECEREDCERIANGKRYCCPCYNSEVLDLSEEEPLCSQCEARVKQKKQAEQKERAEFLEKIKGKYVSSEEWEKNRNGGTNDLADRLNYAFEVRNRCKEDYSPPKFKQHCLNGLAKLDDGYFFNAETGQCRFSKNNQGMCPYFELR